MRSNSMSTDRDGDLTDAALSDKLGAPDLADHLGNTPLSEGERLGMIAAATDHLAKLFDILRIGYRADHNTRETPNRVARMFVDELLRGKFNPAPDLTDFDNVESFDQLIVMGPIDVRSTCAHHLMPIFGDAYIGV